MIKNYLLTAFRSLIKHRSFSIINIFGLSVSMAVCMLIILILQDQFSYDNFHKKRDRIYRIQSRSNLSKIAFNKYASTTWPIAKELKDNYPIVEESVAVHTRFNGEGKSEEKRFMVQGYFVTPSFFDLFDFKLKNSSAPNPLTEPSSIVLTEDVAKKFFSESDPIGKTLVFENFGNLKVTAILPETKLKSHLQFEALVSSSTISSLEKEKKMSAITDNWNDYYQNYVYVLLDKNARQSDLDTALAKISKLKYYDNEKVKLSFYSTPLNDIVPGPLLANEIGQFLPKPFVIFFVGLAIVIMLSAAFNYTSLSIARSLTRAKEYGIRKSFGASTSQLIFQIVTEAVVLSLISLFFADMILQLLLPAFSGMKLMTILKIDPIQNITSYGAYFVFALITGLLAGIIPAFYVASINPVKVFKASSDIRFLKRFTFRKILLVTQYTFSIIFIISIILIYRQMNYMLTTDLGFDKEVVYNITLNGQKFSKVKDLYSQFPEVTSVSAGSHIPGIGNMWPTNIKAKPEDESYNAAYFSVDPYYLSTMGIKLIAGEDFPKDPDINTNLVIINRKAVEYFKYKSLQEAVGQDIFIYDTLPVKIIGVVEDYKSMAFSQIKPLILRMNPAQHNIAVLRINTSDKEATISRFKSAWKSIDPYHDLQGSFLEYSIKDFYNIFSDVLYTVGFTTILAIIVACLGLFGMASYSIQTRLREVGVRKVFGSQSGSVALHIARTFVIMLTIAALIAAPIAYLLNTTWLKFLAFHVTFGAGTILSGIAIVFMLGILTILSQTMKAANSNPVDVLKHE
ncbi:MAG TPA: ABC transporter permease [Bacteroidales bacterium]|nr:ABC transporter permease [Bacteroidales bacterium]